MLINEGINWTGYLPIFCELQSILYSVTLGLDLRTTFLILAYLLIFYLVLLVRGTKGLEGGKKRDETFLLFSGPISSAPAPQMVDSSLWFLHYSWTSLSMPLQRYLQQWGPGLLVVPVLTLLLPLGLPPFHSVHPQDDALSSEVQAPLGHPLPSEIQRSPNSTPPNDSEHKQ